MPWYAIALLIWLGIQAIYAIALVGKPRQPKKPWEAIDSLIECGLAAWAIVELAIR